MISRRLLTKILFRLLKIPIATKYIDHAKKKEWLGLQYPLPEFHNYISTRNLHILQVLGEGVDREQEYWTLVGQRIELGRLFTEAKKNFAIAEKKIIEKQNENAKNEKG